MIVAIEIIYENDFVFYVFFMEEFILLGDCINLNQRCFNDVKTFFLPKELLVMSRNGNYIKIHRNKMTKRTQ